MPANGPVIPGDPQHGSQSTGGGAGWRKERGHCTVNIQIRLIIFFAAKDGEALNNQQKQDWELTVTQIMNSLLLNSDLN